MTTPNTNLKLCLFEQLAQIGKSLGHVNRLLILDILAQGPCQVDLLSHKLGLGIGNVSKHLQTLKQSGLVMSNTKGTQRIYQLSDKAIVPLIKTLRQIAENQMSEVSQLLHEKLQPSVPLTPFNPKELKQALEQEAVVLLDVRPKDEYQAGHIEGAISLPMDTLNSIDLADNINQITNNKPVIVYCRGPYCLWSYEAVEKLQAHGITASRMAEGYPDWQLEPC